VSENGLAYKRAKIFDPFVQRENIYFTLFAVDDDKKIDENHLYNVVAEPYRKIDNNNYQNDNAPAAASYDNDSKQQSYKKQDGSQIPVIEVDEDEIPF